MARMGGQEDENAQANPMPDVLALDDLGSEEKARTIFAPSYEVGEFMRGPENYLKSNAPLEIERDGRAVTITLTLPTVNEAIAVHDRWCAELRDYGSVQMNFGGAILVKSD